jgi:hypothetical protein
MLLRWGTIQRSVTFHVCRHHRRHRAIRRRVTTHHRRAMILRHRATIRRSVRNGYRRHSARNVRHRSLGPSVRCHRCIRRDCRYKDHHRKTGA